MTATEPDPFTVDCPECRQPAGRHCHWPGYDAGDFPHASRVFRARAAADREADEHEADQ